MKIKFYHKAPITKIYATSESRNIRLVEQNVFNAQVYKQISTFGQAGITETKFTLLPETTGTKKTNIGRIFSRQWTSGNKKQQTSEKWETHEIGLTIALVCCLEGTSRPWNKDGEPGQSIMVFLS